MKTTILRRMSLAVPFSCALILGCGSDTSNATGPTSATSPQQTTSTYYSTGKRPEAVVFFKGTGRRFTAEILYDAPDPSIPYTQLVKSIELTEADFGLTQPINNLDRPSPGTMYRRGDSFLIIVSAGDGGHSEFAVLLVEPTGFKKRWNYHTMNGPAKYDVLDELLDKVGAASTESDQAIATHRLWAWIDKNR